MRTIDLNCDVGEERGDEAALLELVTSANIACGFHAGGPRAMRATLDLAARLDVAVGAHPGFPDREGFGRAEMALSAHEIFDIVVYQVGALQALARSAGLPVTHVKAHGALYHAADRQPEVAEALVEAVRLFGARVVLVGSPGGGAEQAARRMAVPFAAEAFADRAYADDGTLLPRSDPRAVLAGTDAEVAERALAMVRDQMLPTVSGGRVPAAFQTLCLHGDDPRAAGRARAIRRAFDTAGIAVAPLHTWVR